MPNFDWDEDDPDCTCETDMFGRCEVHGRPLKTDKCDHCGAGRGSYECRRWCGEDPDEDD